MNRHACRYLVPILLLLGLETGCAIHSSVPYDPANGPKVRTIALLTVPNPREIGFRDPRVASLMVVNPVLGAAAATANDLLNRDSLSQLVTEAGFDFGKEMTRALSERLTRAGYVVIPVYVNRDNQRGLLGDYSKIPSAGADAILDTGVNSAWFGYVTVNLADNKFRPGIFFSVRMVGRERKETLYTEDVMFGYTNSLIRATKLKSPDRFFYEDTDHVLADGKNVVQGFRAGIDAIADHVAAQLKR